MFVSSHSLSSPHYSPYSGSPFVAARRDNGAAAQRPIQEQVLAQLLQRYGKRWFGLPSKGRQAWLFKEAFNEALYHNEGEEVVGEFLQVAATDRDLAVEALHCIFASDVISDEAAVETAAGLERKFAGVIDGVYCHPLHAAVASRLPRRRCIAWLLGPRARVGASSDEGIAVHATGVRNPNLEYCGDTPLTSALSMKQEDKALQLLEYEDVDQATPKTWSCAVRYPLVLRRMIDRGLTGYNEIDRTSVPSQTPTMVAAFYNHMTALKMLLSLPDIHVDTLGDCCMTALEYTANTNLHIVSDRAEPHRCVLRANPKHTGSRWGDYPLHGQFKERPARVLEGSVLLRHTKLSDDKHTSRGRRGLWVRQYKHLHPSIVTRGPSRVRVRCL